ncbi:MAG: hypothetical protein R6T99_02470 [Bacteroidales bacterium]
MKKTVSEFTVGGLRIVCCLIIVVTGFVDTAWSQVMSGIDPELTEKPWLDNTRHRINGHDIIMVFGEYPTNYRHLNFGPITTISYRSPEQINIMIDSIADAEDWQEDKIAAEKEKYEAQAPGGILNIYITRYKEDRANFKWYFVIIRDEEDQEVTEIELDYQAPELPEGNGWWNYTEVMVDKPVELPFYVYLNDKQSSHLSDFKFLVEKPD